MKIARGGHQKIPRPPKWTLAPVPDWFQVARDFQIDREFLDGRIFGGPGKLFGPAEGGALPILQPGSLSSSAATEETTWRRIMGEDRTTLHDAAVLVVLFAGEITSSGGPELLLVKRRSDAPAHPGEIAFPGGRKHDDDASLLETALREAEEETGLARSHVEVLASMPATRTGGSRYVVTPYLAWANAVGPLAPQESEIESILTVPISHLLDPDVYRIERWFLPRSADRYIEMYFFDIGGETIWGFTARVLHQLLAFLFSD